MFVYLCCAKTILTELLFSKNSSIPKQNISFNQLKTTQHSFSRHASLPLICLNLKPVDGDKEHELLEVFHDLSEVLLFAQL